jgi:hypothetical protein
MRVANDPSTPAAEREMAQRAVRDMNKNGVFFLLGGAVGRLFGAAAGWLGLGAQASRAAGASSTVLARIATGKSIQQAVVQLNQAGATQAQALATLQQVVQGSQRILVPGTLQGTPSTIVLAGKVVGEGMTTPVVAVAANGTSTFGAGVARWVNGALEIAEFVPK